VWPRHALAQYGQAARYEITRSRELQLNATLHAAGEPRYSTLRLTAGGVAGGLVGLAIGAAVGAVVASDQDEDEEGEPWVDAAWGAAVGGMAGESIGMGAGVWLANGRQGNLLIDLVGSLVIGGIGFAVLAENQDPPIGPIMLAVTPLAQLGVTILLERRTAR